MTVGNYPLTRNALRTAIANAEFIEEGLDRELTKLPKWSDLWWRKLRRLDEVRSEIVFLKEYWTPPPIRRPEQLDESEDDGEEEVYKLEPYKGI